MGPGGYAWILPAIFQDEAELLTQQDEQRCPNYVETPLLTMSTRSHVTGEPLEPKLLRPATMMMMMMTMGGDDDDDYYYYYCSFYCYCDDSWRNGTVGRKILRRHLWRQIMPAECGELKQPTAGDHHCQPSLEMPLSPDILALLLVFTLAITALSVGS